MRDLIFLTQRQVEELHQKGILGFGGSYGIRDRSLFESAIAQPLQAYYYKGGDVFEIAATYAYHLAQAQACFDGNKRTGIAAAFLFLNLNGIPTDFDSLPLYDAMIAIAERKMSKEELAFLLRHFCSRKN